MYRGLATLDAAGKMSIAQLPDAAATDSELTAFARDRGAGTTLPTTDLRRGDVYYHTGVTCLMRYNGTAWRQAEVPSVVGNTARQAMITNYLSVLHSGFQIFHEGHGLVQTWGGTPAAFRFVLTGQGQYTTNADGYVYIAHNGGQAPLSWGCGQYASSTQGQTNVSKVTAASQDATNLVMQFVRTDSSSVFNNPNLGASWWARF